MVRVVGIIFVFIFTVSVQAWSAFSSPHCVDLFHNGVEIQEVYSALPENTFVLDTGNTFFNRNIDKLIKYYIKYPESKAHRIYLGLLATAEDLQPILSKGLAPTYDTAKYDSVLNLKEAVQHSFGYAGPNVDFMSAIIEINQLRCVGCFRLVERGNGPLRIERRVDPRAIENIYILTKGIRPIYVPMDLQRFRANP